MGRWMAGYTVKERIFLYYMVFFILISGLTIIGNIASGLAFSYNYKWIATLVTSGIFFRLSLDKKKAVIVRRIGIYLFSFLMLPVCWLSSAGLVSPSITYFLSAFDPDQYHDKGHRADRGECRLYPDQSGHGLFVQYPPPFFQHHNKNPSSLWTGL